jgi:hypothetical protein
MEVAFEVDAWQPHVKLVKHDAVRQTNGTKQLSLSEFKEAYVSAIENYAGGIYIAPAHALFDAVFPWSHL